MKNIPEKIYLQVGEDVEQDEDFHNLYREAVSWCDERIFHNDIEYIRKDLIPQYMQCDEACEYHCTKNGEQEKECEARKLLPSDDRIVAEAIQAARKVDTEVGLLPSNNDIKMFCLGAKWMRDLVQNNS